MGITEDETEPKSGGGDDEGDDGDDVGEIEKFGIWPENERAWRAFQAVRGLWRYHPTGGLLGLDRPNVKAELGMRKIKVNAALLDDLAEIEGGVLEVWNAKQ